MQNGEDGEIRHGDRQCTERCAICNKLMDMLKEITGIYIHKRARGNTADVDR